MEENVVDPKSTGILPLYPNVQSIVDSEKSGKATEIARHQIEIVTPVISRTSEARPMEAYCAVVIDRHNKLKETLRKSGLLLLMSGNLPFSFKLLSHYCYLGEGKPDFDPWICQKLRYLKMVRAQNGSAEITENPYRIPVKRITGFKDGNPIIQRHNVNVPMSSALYALAGQGSMNIGVAASRIGFAANMMMALTPVAAIFSNSRFIYKGISAYHWNRNYYAIKGMGSKEVLFHFLKPEYFKAQGAEAILEWFEYCFTRKLLVPFNNGGGKRDSFCPYLRTRAGQAWTFGPRITWGVAPESSRQTIWLEHNPEDIQATLAETMALSLLTAGLMAHYHYCGLTDVNQLIPANQIKAVCQDISKYSPYSKKSLVQWNGESLRADLWVMDRLIPAALDGIKRDDLCDSNLAERMLDVLKRALLNRCTGSDWILTRAKQLDSASLQTMHKIILELAGIQSEIEETLGNPRGLYDILKEQGRI